MSLAIIGENRQKKNGVGMEMQGLQILLVNNGKEELGKRGHQTGGDGAHEELVEGAPFALRKGGAGLEHGRPVVALRRHHLARPSKILLRHSQRIQGGQVPCSGWGLARRHALLGCRVGVDLEISEARRTGARKEIWAVKEKAKKVSLDRYHSLISLCSCRGIMGEPGRPCPINRHTAPKAAGYWGPRRFALASSLLC